MIPDIGYAALILAMAMAFGQAYTANDKSRHIAYVVFISLAIAFACLIISYINSDFSVRNVFENSHTLKPMLYKITGSWGNHEGSMLLFVLILSSFNALFAACSASRLKDEILSFQGWITFGLLTYIVFTSNPFERMFPVPANGMGLNPLLQDIGLAIHPPMLYVGYVGFSLALSFAIAGLLTREVDRDWAKTLKPWVVVSWSFLTAGIALGSWWAYRELGWGGFWFWDPVENSSLLPWLTGTALLHCLIVLEKREALIGWTLFLAITTFCLSLIGFFLVRSGVLTSVHTFASDPSRGIFMLALLAIIAIYAFSLFALRLNALKPGNNFQPISKESSILVNNLLLLTLATSILLATLYPIILDILSDTTVSVGAPYFNLIFIPIAFAILFIAAIGPMITWQKGTLLLPFKKLGFSFLVALVIGIAIWYKEGQQLTLSVIGFMLSAWLVVGTFRTIFDHVRSDQESHFIAKTKLIKLPRNLYAMLLAHSGLAVLAFAISGLFAWQIEKELWVKPQDNIALSEYTIQLIKIETIHGENYVARQGTFSVADNGAIITALYPEVRLFPVRNTRTTEAAIHSTLWSDVYIVIGDHEDEKGLAVRVYLKPFMNWIWIGCAMIAIGGLISLSDKRRRKA